jgi:polar amino acid transport system permease protein
VNSPWSGSAAQGIAWLLVVLAVASVSALLFVRLAPQTDFSGVWQYRRLLWQGWWQTLAVAIGALGLSCVLAVMWCAFSLGPLRALRTLALFATELLRGTPLLVQLLLGFYVLANALGWDNRLAVGITLLALHSSVYLGEMLRGGIESVAATQHEAALAVGFNRAQAYRHVILPQALRRVLPGMAGQSVNLVKDSSLLSVIGVMEFTKQAQTANSLTYSSFEAYLPLALGYLILTVPLSMWARSLEKRLATD